MNVCIAKNVSLDRFYKHYAGTGPSPNLAFSVFSLVDPRKGEISDISFVVMRENCIVRNLTKWRLFLDNFREMMK